MGCVLGGHINIAKEFRMRAHCQIQLALLELKRCVYLLVLSYRHCVEGKSVRVLLAGLRMWKNEFIMGISQADH